MMKYRVVAAFASILTVAAALPGQAQMTRPRTVTKHYAWHETTFAGGGAAIVVHPRRGERWVSVTLADRSQTNVPAWIGEDRDRDGSPDWSVSFCTTSPRLRLSGTGAPVAVRAKYEAGGNLPNCPLIAALGGTATFTFGHRCRPDPAQEPQSPETCARPRSSAAATGSR
jgi:hypothetical protein